MLDLFSSSTSVTEPNCLPMLHLRRNDFLMQICLSLVGVLYISDACPCNLATQGRHLRSVELQNDSKTIICLGNENMTRVDMMT